MSETRDYFPFINRNLAEYDAQPGYPVTYETHPQLMAIDLHWCLNEIVRLRDAIDALQDNLAADVGDWGQAMSIIHDAQKMLTPMPTRDGDSTSGSEAG